MITTWMVATLVLAVYALGGVPAGACEQDEKPSVAEADQNTAEKARDENLVMPGRMAFRDPQTGERVSRPSAEEVEAMKAAFARHFDQSTEDLEEVELPNGTIMIDLRGRFQHATIVNRNPDGSRTHTCTQSLEAATKAMSSESKSDTEASAVVKPATK